MVPQGDPPSTTAPLQCISSVSRQSEIQLKGIRGKWGLCGTVAREPRREKGRWEGCAKVERQKGSGGGQRGRMGGGVRNCKFL